MVNALHNPYATNNMHSGVDLRSTFPKCRCSSGWGLRIIIPVTPTAAGSGRVRCGTGQTWGGGSLFVGVKPWETGHHCIGLSGGYALAFDVHLSSQADKVYSDHGFLVRGTYDYRFNSCVSIGILVQYTRYCACFHARHPFCRGVGRFPPLRENSLWVSPNH